jgi:predicted small lipoprotein YifL
MILRRFVILAVLAGLLAACGVRGNPELPPDAKKDQQKTNSPFVLDGLL